MIEIIQPQQTSHDVLRWSAALLTTAAAAVHFAVTPEHFDEYWLFGAFFATAAWAQVLWALLLMRSDARGMLQIGVLGNLAIAAVWAVSRTTGLPFGPEPGAREPVAFIDLLATGIELLAVLALTVLTRAPRRPLTRRTVAAAMIALVVTIVSVTTAAIAGGAGSGHDADVQGSPEGDHVGASGDAHLIEKEIS